ncbi:hypothetical protein N9X92_02325 [Gammaproteobacteria bacterium]|nr:hypothetical protein [Gammaproteobacteria bacterium]
MASSTIGSSSRLANGIDPEAFWDGSYAYYSNELENTQGFRIFWEKYESAFAEPFKSHVLEIFNL